MNEVTKLKKYRCSNCMFGTFFRIFCLFPFCFLLFPELSYFTCETTEGGDGWTEGSMCVFPFTFRSVTYDRCTTTWNFGKHWCFTVPNGSSGSPWGNCVMNTCGIGK